MTYEAALEMGVRQARATLAALQAAMARGGSLPAWGHDLHAGVFPFCARGNGQIVPIGTAFSVGKVGVVATALHNIQDALRFHPDGDRLRRVGLIHGGDLAPLELALLHRHYPGPRHGRFAVWPLETVHGARPTDVVFGFATFQQEFPYIALPLSFVPPRVGSTVRIVGYGGMRTDHEIEEAALQAGDIRQLVDAGLGLNVVETTVTAVLTQRVARGFTEGPCLLVEGDIPHGVSGGPVFNQDGYVCGIAASSLAELDPEHPKSFVALLNWNLSTNIRLRVVHGGEELISERTLMDLIIAGVVPTDGSERHVQMVATEEGIYIGTRVHRGDADHVYEDLGALDDGERAQPND